MSCLFAFSFNQMTKMARNDVLVGLPCSPVINVFLDSNGIVKTIEDGWLPHWYWWMPLSNASILYLSFLLHWFLIWCGIVCYIFCCRFLTVLIILYWLLTRGNGGLGDGFAGWEFFCPPVSPLWRIVHFQGSSYFAICLAKDLYTLSCQ